MAGNSHGYKKAQLNWFNHYIRVKVTAINTPLANLFTPLEVKKDLFF